VVFGSFRGFVVCVPMDNHAFHATFQKKSSGPLLAWDSPFGLHLFVVDRTSWKAFNAASETLFSLI